MSGVQASYVNYLLFINAKKKTSKPITVQIMLTMFLRIVDYTVDRNFIVRMKPIKKSESDRAARAKTHEVVFSCQEELSYAILVATYRYSGKSYLPALP